jgi:hypothetical protein
MTPSTPRRSRRPTDQPSVAWQLAGDRWSSTKTYVKVSGVWRYVYRAVDQRGQVIGVYGPYLGLACDQTTQQCPLACRERTSPRRPGPCRRGVREEQARRTTRRIRRQSASRVTRRSTGLDHSSRSGSESFTAHPACRLRRPTGSRQSFDPSVSASRPVNRGLGRLSGTMTGWPLAHLPNGSRRRRRAGPLPLRSRPRRTHLRSSDVDDLRVPPVREAVHRSRRSSTVHQPPVRGE